MTDIIDPVAIRFCNEKVRIMADLYAQGHYRAKAMLDTWDAQDLSSKFPADASIIIDGSVKDGRTQITSGDVQVMITILRAFVTNTEANEDAVLSQILKVAVNTRK